MATALILQVLLLPVHVTLAWLFLRLRAGVPRSDWRVFDSVVIAGAFLAWAGVVPLVLTPAEPGTSPIWAVVNVTAAAYIAFNTVLWGGWACRLLLHRRRSA